MEYKRYYHVMLGKKHFDIVLAYSKEDAISQVEKRFGKAKSYYGGNEYSAYICKDD